MPAAGRCSAVTPPARHATSLPYELCDAREPPDMAPVSAHWHRLPGRTRMANLRPAARPPRALLRGRVIEGLFRSGDGDGDEGRLVCCRTARAGVGWLQSARVGVQLPALANCRTWPYERASKDLTGRNPRGRPTISRQRRPSSIHPGISSGSAPASRHYPPGGDASALPFAPSSGPAWSARASASCPSPSWSPPWNARAGPGPRTAAS